MNNLSFIKHYIGNVEFSQTLNKQELLNLLGEKPVNIGKLSQFTRKTTVPSNYRTVVWKLLSGITPCFAESQEFVHHQHTLMYDDLFQALKSLKLAAPIIHKDNEPNGHSMFSQSVTIKLNRNHYINDIKNPEPEHFFLMWLISEARLLRNPEIQLNAPENQKYILIGHKLHCLIDDSVDMFHICSSLWTSLRKNDALVKECVQSAIGLLHKKNDSLHRHLNKIGLFNDTLLEDHSLSLFCEIFTESSIEKIIDKIFAGSFEILTYLIVTLLIHLQNSLFMATSVEKVRNIFYQIRKEQADIVLTTTLEAWHKKNSFR